MAQRSSKDVNYWNNNKVIISQPLIIDDITELYSLVNGVTSSSTWTVELIDALTTDVYSPQDLNISTYSIISGSGELSIDLNGVTYSLGESVLQGDKLTFTTTTESVYNLTINYV